MFGFSIVECSPLRLGLAGICVFLLTVVPVILCIYRWQFYPLSRYPGPVVAKLTDLYLVYYASKGEAQIQLQTLHRIYGPVVRVGPQKLSFSTAEAYHDIYESKILQKSKGYPAMNPTPTTSNTLTVVDKDAHRQRRKSLAPAFSEHALRSFEPIILQNVDILLKETIRATEGSQNGGWSDALNMIDRCKYFTLDVMTAFGFGQTLHAQTQRRNRGILLGMRTGSMLSGICAQYPHLRHCKAIIERLIRSSNTWTRERFAGLMRQIVKTRLGETHDAKQDLLSFIMRSKENTIGNGLTLEELWMESRMLMLAGTDTIASVFAATLFYLSRNPSCYQKLRSEIRTTFLSDAEIHSGRRLGECLYLRAAINEAMRLSPPIGMALWRETCEDITIDGHLVPAGTDMGCAMYGLFRSEDTFPRASEYIPERWLLSDAEWNIHLPDAQYAFHPFSIGSRKCVGQSMAYAELTLALAKLIWRFDFRAPSGPLNRIGCAPPTQENRKQIEQYRIVEYVTPLPDGPYLEFHCREDSTLL